ncbi:DUF1501 domain-containing protein [Candidatus Laterigemmans baculatus]|uniref:DUF1501 domain-containing protein n=1 Tax=Candidatus Laterigemmans baculatus TaxID=2770505 RepID=UPI0013DC6B2D|nr:DUF1501 domain-containing protein [Candidatus Laterigemmans baculatus]
MSKPTAPSPDWLGLSSRRDLLRRSGLGIGALGLWSVIGDEGRLIAESDQAGGGPLEVRSPHFPGKAKRVIHFFLNGGPSHVDTFDPKPALAKYAGQPLGETLTTERKTGAAFPSPFKFRRYGESGIEVSELFSRTAQHIDEIAVVRSMYAQVPNHEPSLMLMNCGDSVQPRPSMGAWVMYGLGTENQNLPGFIAMCPGGLPIKDTENWQSAFLPGVFQGTYVDSQHREFRRLIENIEHPHVSTADQRRQLDLLAQWNARHLSERTDDRLEARIHAYELAFRMQHDAAEAFDLSREPAYIQEMYGTEVHGRQTLIARRLLERGVRYVQLWHGAGQPWDNHENIEDNHRRLAGQIDQPIAALLSDLKQRGMLEDTLVLWGGEFGRTPTVELGGDGNPKLGRDHNHYGFTVWMAGGGIKGGTVYGGTDEFGFKAVDRPTSVHDLHATILHALGLDHQRLTYRYAGRDFRLTDVHGNVIRDILA